MRSFGYKFAVIKSSWGIVCILTSGIYPSTGPMEASTGLVVWIQMLLSVLSGTFWFAGQVCFRVLLAGEPAVCQRRPKVKGSPLTTHNREFRRQSASSSRIE